jgi:flagellar protein FlaG
MGIRIDQAGSPGLDPAAGISSGVNTARRIASSPPATSQSASSVSVEQQMFSATTVPATTYTSASVSVPAIDSAEMESNLQGINEYLSETGSSLNFIRDEASGRSAVQVLDENGEVIRQIPPQELLDVYARIRDIVGILLDESG